MFMNQLLPIGDPPARLAPVALTFTDTLARIVGSRWFTLFLVLLGLFLLFLILLRVYGSMRSRRLSRIVYERCFSEEGVYEGDEVELIETVRNTGFSLCSAWILSLTFTMNWTWRSMSRIRAAPCSM